MINNLPIYLIKLIKSFLSQRRFRVKLGSEYSSCKYPEAGVPQGAVLSPILFNILICDMPTPSNCTLAQFADDAAILTSNRRASTIKNTLDKGLACLDRYYKKWKLKINPQKTELAFFTRRRLERAFPRTNLVLDNQTIMWQDNAKYLGVILDQKLTFKKHVDSIVTKCGKIIRMLYSLLSRNSKLNYTNKLLIYKMIIQPIILYGCPVWGSCALSHLRLLQRTQNRILKMCLNKPWRYPTLDLHNDAKIDNIMDKIMRSRQKFENRCQFASNPLIVGLFG